MRSALLILALLLLAAPARAFVVSEDPFEGNSFTVGGAVRSYNLVLRGGPLDNPLAPKDYNPASLSIVAVRPKLELKRAKFDFTVHDELVSTASTLPTALVGSALSIGQGAETPSWLPLQWTAVDRASYKLRDRVDWLYVGYTLGDFSLKIGRQPVSIGRGQIWTPEDLLAPFSPLQINTEYKPGVDAARVDWTISDRATLLVVGSLGARNSGHDFQVKKDGSAALTRFELSLDKLRLGALAGMVRGDAVGGIDLFVDLGHQSDLHGSGTVTYVPDRSRRRYGRAAFNRAVLGTTTQPVKKLLLTAEMYFNGSGAPRPSDYLAEFSSPRFAVGEEYNVGRLYAGIAADWEVHPLLHALASAIVNLEDPSALLAPELDYNIAQNALLVAGAFIPVGRSARYTGFSPTPRSEFGLYPEMYHLDAKLYF
jgi:hypothetical protein